MTAVDANVGKKNETSLYTAWTLSFTAPQAEEAQSVLQGYIRYISDIVVKETLEDIRNKLFIKTSYEKEKLAMDRVRLKTRWKQISSDSTTPRKLRMPPGLKSRSTVMAGGER